MGTQDGKVEIDNIVEAYEHAYGKTWDRDEPPDCVTLAALGTQKNEPVAEHQAKLKEYAHLSELSMTSPSGKVISIENDWRYQANRSRIQKKLKEMTLSDQAYAVAEINKIVWEALKPNLIFRELVSIWHTNNPTYRFIRAILIPRAFDVGEGTEVRIAGERYDYIDVNMRKIGVRPLISREMVEDAAWDVVARQLAEGGRAMAQKENELGLAVLLTQGTSGNNYQGYGSNVNTANNNYMTYLDMVNGIGTLREQNAFPDTLAVHPEEEADLLVDQNYINSFYFGGLMKKALGPPDFFGQILGIRTLTSTLMTAGYALLIDTARAAGFVIRRDVTVENLIDPVKDLSGAVFTERMNLGVLRAPAICQITVSGTPALPTQESSA